MRFHHQTRNSGQYQKLREKCLQILLYKIVSFFSSLVQNASCQAFGPPGLVRLIVSLPLHLFGVYPYICLYCHSRSFTGNLAAEPRCQAFQLHGYSDLPNRQTSSNNVMDMLVLLDDGFLPAISAKKSPNLFSQRGAYFRPAAASQMAWVVGRKQHPR